MFIELRSLRNVKLQTSEIFGIASARLRSSGARDLFPNVSYKHLAAAMTMLRFLGPDASSLNPMFNPSRNSTLET